jgi:hypothetical protein
MTIKRIRGVAAIAAIALLGVGLAGCSTASTPKAKSSHASSHTEKPFAPTDLTGAWVQSNSKSKDSYQAATITADAIEVDWVSDGGSTTSLYWAGSYAAPTTTGNTFAWTSNNDRSKTESAMLASSDPTKKFSYDNGVISYSVSALGTTTTVELKKK